MNTIIHLLTALSLLCEASIDLSVTDLMLCTDCEPPDLFVVVYL